jgi:hypothetical protein
MKKSALIIFVYFLGHTLSVAQGNYKLRIGINNCFSAGHYNKWGGEVVNNEYYTFKKVPLTSKTFPELALNLFIEKKINAKNALQVGVVLNDGVGAGYKIGSQGIRLGTSTGFTEVTGSYGGSEGGLACTRVFAGFTHEFLPLSTLCDKPLKKFNVATEIVLGINVILMPYGVPYKNVVGFGYRTVLKTGDSMDVSMSSYKLERKWGATVLGGFNFKLRKYEKEIITLGVSYEQGIWSMVAGQADIYVKNYHFTEKVLSRGSRLNVTVSRAFGFPKFKKKEKKIMSRVK